MSFGDSLGVFGSFYELERSFILKVLLLFFMHTDIYG